MLFLMAAGKHVLYLGQITLFLTTAPETAGRVSATVGLVKRFLWPLACGAVRPG